MALDVSAKDLKLGIVGTGAMGRGIAQIAAQANIHVLLYDGALGAANRAAETIASTLYALAEKGKIDKDTAASAVGRLEVVHYLADMTSCRLVIEAVVEDLEVKRQLFKSLEDIVDHECILATNTSSLSVTAIAAACKLPARVAGFHFFNPVPLMKIVEIIDGLLTEPWVGEALVGLAQRMGHAPVRAKDTPGFIVNHAGRGFVTEALRVLGEEVAPFHEIDRIMREAAGFRMGPFELLDLTALDVSQPVMESIYNQYFHEPRFRPSALSAQRLRGGLLGRKTGRGFYTYDNNQPLPLPVPPVPKATPKPVWVSPAQPEFGRQVARLVEELGADRDFGQRPRPDALCIVTPLGQDTTSCCLAEGLDARRTVAVDALFDLSKLRTLMLTPITAHDIRDAAHALLAADGVPVSVICDSAGLVAQRIVATIVNIGCDIAQQRIAVPEDIDRAVQLGLGYPRGPLAMGDAVGARNILAIVENMLSFYGDPRYRPSPWLKRRALLGVSLLTPEAGRSA
jgi:3-hydroxybutyryl-CoA dehydrogenase